MLELVNLVAIDCYFMRR